MAFYPGRRLPAFIRLRRGKRRPCPGLIYAALSGHRTSDEEIVKLVFAQNPKLKKVRVLAEAQALVNEHLANIFGRHSFDIDTEVAREVSQGESELDIE